MALSYDPMGRTRNGKKLFWYGLYWMLLNFWSKYFMFDDNFCCRTVIYYDKCISQQALIAYKVGIDKGPEKV